MVAYDVCRLCQIIKFVAYDVCRFIGIVPHDVFRLIGFVAYEVGRIMTLVAHHDVCRFEGLSQYRLCPYRFHLSLGALVETLFSIGLSL